MLNLLWGGGLITKAAMGAMLVGLIFTGTGYVSRGISLDKKEKQIVVLQENNTILKSNNTTLRSNLDAAADANKSVVETNKKLLAERKESQALIQELAKQKQKSQETLAQANKTIDDMLKDPKNNGELSPVLRETIRGIQERSKK